MKRLIVMTALLTLGVWACGDDEDDAFEGEGNRFHSGTPGVCDLPSCPAPPFGVACCTPLAQCGWDPLGLGTNCAPNPGAPLSDRVCSLDACPEPPVGIQCCTPFGLCGTDPFATGQSCFPNPPPVNIAPPEPVDAAAFITCDVDACEESELGPSCCLPDGECGVDTLGVGFCFPRPPEIDASIPQNPISTDPPNDATVDGQCPSFIGFFGPIWGCCSPFGACGTFEAGQCLLPVGTPVPLSSAPDGGIPPNVIPCDPAEPFEFPAGEAEEADAPE